MKIHRNDALSTGHGEKIGNELGADGGAGADLAVLTGIAEIGNDGRDAAGAGALQGIKDKAQFHEGLVGRGAGGLNDEHVVPANAGADFNAQLSVAERGAERRCEGTAEVVANVHGQLWIGRTRKNFEVAVHRNMPFLSKVSRDTKAAPPPGEAETNDNWLGRQDLNLRIADPKPAALPLGDTPPCPVDTTTQTRKGPNTSADSLWFRSAPAACAARPESRKSPNSVEPLPLMPAMSAPASRSRVFNAAREG